jgi:hypothetical protein
MKKFIYLLLLTSSLFLSNKVLGQTYPPDCIVKKYSSTLKQDNPVNMVTKGTFSSVYVPVSFARLVYDNGNVYLGETFNIGASYVFGTANVNIHLDGSATLSETFYYGAATTFGVAQNTNADGSVSSFTLGAVGGFNQFSLLAGRDFLQKKFVLGVNYNLAGLPFFNSATKIRLK